MCIFSIIYIIIKGISHISAHDQLQRIQSYGTTAPPQILKEGQALPFVVRFTYQKHLKHGMDIDDRNRLVNLMNSRDVVCILHSGLYCTGR